MTVHPLKEEVLTFVRELCIHNNKDWFDENRTHYTKDIRPAIINFTQEVINLFNQQGENIDVDPKKCIFRINRDIRFSKDKSIQECTLRLEPSFSKSMVEFIS